MGKTADQPNFGPTEEVASPSSPDVLSALLRFIPDGVTIAMGPDLKICHTSDYALARLGLARETLLGIAAGEHMEAWQIFNPDGQSRPAAEDMPLVRAGRRGETVVDCELLIRTAGGEDIPVLVNAAPITDWDGNIVGALNSWHDVSQMRRNEQRLRDALEESETLLRESYHRTKNHLQIIASLVQMEAARTSPECRDFAERIENRLAVVASAQEGFYRSNTFTKVHAGEHLRRIAAALESERVAVVVDAPPDVELAADQATAVALIVNEAICNALKHAFPGGAAGSITVGLRRKEGTVTIIVADDGIGLGALPTKDSLGLRLVRLLARQLDGSVALDDGPTGGALLTLVFPDRSGE